MLFKNIIIGFLNLPNNLFFYFSAYIISLFFAFFITFFVFKILPRTRLLEKINKEINKHSLLFLILSICLISGFYIGYSLIKHYHFLTTALDLGLADQVIWKYSQFKVPFSSIQNYHIWREHFHPIWMLIAPFFWIYNNARTLLILDPLIIGLGAFPIYWFGKKYLKNTVFALFFVWVYLLFSGVWFTIDGPFHVESIAATLLIFSLWFLENKRKGIFFILIFLLLLCKESMSIYVFFIGIYALFVKKEKTIGITCMIGGIFWYYVAVYRIIGHFGNYGLYSYWQLGPNAIEAMKTIVTRPIYSLSIFFSPQKKIDTLINLFLPFGLFPLFSPTTLILSIPMLAERFFSDVPALWSVQFHYGMTIAPVLFLATIRGIKNIYSKLIKDKTNISLNKFLLFCSILIFGLTIFNTKPILKRLYFVKMDIGNNSNYDNAVYSALDMIDDNNSVAAQEVFLTHLAHRDRIYLLPVINNAEFILISEHYYCWPMTDDDRIKLIEQLKKNKIYKEVFNQQGVFLFKYTN